MTTPNAASRPARRLLPLLVLLLVAAVGVTVWALNRDDEVAPAATKPLVVLSLSLPAGTEGKCLMPTAEALAQMEKPFRGTLDSVDGTIARFSVTEHYDDSDFTTVELSVPDASSPVLLEGGMPLTVGTEYLLSSRDGQVVQCGFSGEALAPLEALYRQAFGD